MDAGHQSIPKQWYKPKTLFIVLLLLVTGTLVYSLFPSRFFFLNDDFIHIPMASDGTIGHHNGARHINDFSLYLDFLWSGNSAMGYHFTNALLHLVNVFLWLILLKKIGQSLKINLSTTLALPMAGLFAVYAFHAETLFWILCRTASLSMLLVLLAWLFLLHTPSRWWLIFPSISCFLLALFTYETSWLYPIYLATWWWFSRISNVNQKKLRWPILITWLVMLLYLPIRKWLIHEIISQYEASNVLQPNLGKILENSFKLFFRTFLPPVEQTLLFGSFCGLVLCVIVGLVWTIRKNKSDDKLWWLLLICWVLSYLPFISLGVSVTGYESDRYLYFASLFASAWMVYSLYLLKDYFQKIATSMLLLLFCYHSIFLIKASNDFEKAGKLSNHTMQLLQEQSQKSSVQLEKLPASWKGIPIFRYGFEDALEWRLGHDASTRVSVVSTEVFTGPVPYPLVLKAKVDTAIIIFEQ